MNYLLDEFEKCSALKRRVEKLSCRTAQRLWVQAGLAIELIQQKHNREEFDQDVKLKPSVRATGKDAATSTLPVEANKEKKGKKSKKREPNSGGFLVLKGPNSHFPLAWLSNRQTSASRPKVVTLARFLYQEGLPYSL